MKFYIVNLENKWKNTLIVEFFDIYFLYYKEDKLWSYTCKEIQTEFRENKEEIKNEIDLILLESIKESFQKFIKKETTKDLINMVKKIYKRE